MNAPKLCLSLLLVCSSLLMSSCAATKGDAPQGDAPIWKEVEPNQLTFSCEKPMSVPTFLMWAQSVTNERYTYNPEMVKDLEISWVGEMKCPKDEFGQFVQTMLHVKGLALRKFQHGDVEVLEVVPAERG